VEILENRGWAPGQVELMVLRLDVAFGNPAAQFSPEMCESKPRGGLLVYCYKWEVTGVIKR